MKSLSSKYRFIYVLLSIVVFCKMLPAQEGFRVFPYLQNPGPYAITIMWFSEENSPGQLSYWQQGYEIKTNINSSPASAEALAYSAWENTTYFDGNAPSYPYRHRLRIENLLPATKYEYTVTQGSDSFTSSFHTAPVGNAPVRFIVYSDSETEPESNDNFTTWPDPVSGTQRPYLIDQTLGYQNNLDVIKSRQPDMVFIAGDLVESGGEQRDWDEFWRHNTNITSEQSVAGEIPVIAALGNHEYYEGPSLDRYNQPGSERAVKRFLTYFEAPANNSPDVEQEGRYYCLQYGPATFIVLDVTNNGTNKSDEDTNFYLLGEDDPDGGHASDFGPGSEQYEWLEERLIESQLKSMFTFVIFHHAPYSSGPHGYPPGEVENTDDQSGRPVRVLTPIFMKYGVDAVIAGHDEIWERSEISGMEIMPDQDEAAHTIHFYDVGIGGDGLRGPEEGLDNPDQKFLAHTDAPEVWENNVLKSGGKHYGHLEVDILPTEYGDWQAILKPVYILPLLDPVSSTYSDYERKTYDDEIILTRFYSDIAVPVEYTSFSAVPDNDGIMITWETPTEKGNYGFEIQRRIESEWQEVVFLEGNGTTTQPSLYEYLDTCSAVFEPGNILYYHLKQIDINGNIYYSDSVLVEIPDTYSFSRNYPNPFDTETTIEYYLPEPCQVSVKVFDLQGKILRILDDARKDVGFCKTVWDGKDDRGKIVPSGFYFYRIETSTGQTEIRRIIFRK